MRNYKNINTAPIRSGKNLTTDIVAEKIFQSTVSKAVNFCCRGYRAVVRTGSTCMNS